MPNTREPAVTATTVTGLILSAATVLGTVGLHTLGDYFTTNATVLSAIIVGLVTLGAPVLAGLHIRARVAPVVSLVERVEPAVAALVSEVSDEMDPEPDLDNDRPRPGPLVTGARAPIQSSEADSAEQTEVKKAADKPAKKTAR